MIINLAEYKNNKKKLTLAFIKKQVMLDSKLTPRDLTDNLIIKLDILANAIYDFHNELN